MEAVERGRVAEAGGRPGSGAPRARRGCARRRGPRRARSAASPASNEPAWSSRSRVASCEETSLGSGRSARRCARAGRGRRDGGRRRGDGQLREDRERRADGERRVVAGDGFGGGRGGAGTERSAAAGRRVRERGVAGGRGPAGGGGGGVGGTAGSCVARRRMASAICEASALSASAREEASVSARPAASGSVGKSRRPSASRVRARSSPTDCLTSTSRASARRLGLARGRLEFELTALGDDARVQLARGHREARGGLVIERARRGLGGGEGDAARGLHALEIAGERQLEERQRASKFFPRTRRSAMPRAMSGSGPTSAWRRESSRMPAPPPWIASRTSASRKAWSATCEGSRRPAMRASSSTAACASRGVPCRRRGTRGGALRARSPATSARAWRRGGRARGRRRRRRWPRRRGRRRGRSPRADPRARARTSRADRARRRGRDRRRGAVRAPRAPRAPPRARRSAPPSRGSARPS